MFHKAGYGRIAGFGLLAVALLVSGIGCQKKAEETMTLREAAAAAEEAGLTIKEGLNEVSGKVKTALGNYFYLPQVPGFDIAVTGQIQGGDVTALVDKEVSVKALFNRQDPNLLVAQSIDIKDGAVATNVYTSTDAAAPADHLTQTARAEFQALVITGVNKSEEWEGKGKGKLRGKLVAGPNNQGSWISILDASDKEIGKVIVDGKSNYADYYLKKLRLFDAYHFYLTIKESVPRNLRAKAKELFHADVVAVGLY
ncbi:MAG: hypothetical protein FJY80_00790 [Candidatus Aminicenantes bacterium]|nr:hypothetical protein [Candidatus Aminicenantes bacterium]